MQTWNLHPHWTSGYERPTKDLPQEGHGQNDDDGSGVAEVKVGGEVDEPLSVNSHEVDNLSHSRLFASRAGDAKCLEQSRHLGVKPLWPHVKPLHYDWTYRSGF